MTLVIVAFFAVGGLLFWYEYVRIRRYGGGSREIAAFVIGMVVAGGFSLAVLLDLPIPNPTKAIESLFEPLTHKILAQR